MASNQRPLRVALLGCGRIAGFFHGPILGRHIAIDFVAFADRDPVARDRVAQYAEGAVCFADWRRAIETSDLDAVVICLPPALHAHAALAAFERGLNVYVEKPIALDTGEAERMVEACRIAERIGMAGFNFRFHPLFEDARSRRIAGDLGKIHAIRTLFTSARRELPGWKGTEGAGGDALSDLATHHLDLIPYLAGSAIEGASLQLRETKEVSGSLATLDGRLANGCQIQMTVSQTTGHGAHRMELLTEKGHLAIDLSKTLPQALQTPPGRMARFQRLRRQLMEIHPRELLRTPGSDPSFATALDSFVRACRGETISYPDLEAGAAVVRLIENVRARSSTFATGEIMRGVA